MSTMVPESIFPSEKWGDFVSLTIYAMTFLAVVIFTIVNARRTKTKFDGLSRALTAREIVLFISYTLAAANILIDNLRPAEVRWTIRTAGIMCNVALFLLLASDRTRLGRWIQRHTPERFKS
jgi:hypothetical protein